MISLIVFIDRNRVGHLVKVYKLKVNVRFPYDSEWARDQILLCGFFVIIIIAWTQRGVTCCAGGGRGRRRRRGRHSSMCKWISGGRAYRQTDFISYGLLYCVSADGIMSLQKEMNITQYQRPNGRIRQSYKVTQLR